MFYLSDRLKITGNTGQQEGRQQGGCSEKVGREGHERGGKNALKKVRKKIEKRKLGKKNFRAWVGRLFGFGFPWAGLPMGSRHKLA